MISCYRIIDLGGEFTGQYLITETRGEFAVSTRTNVHYDKMTKRQMEKLHKELKSQREARNIA